MTDIWTSRAVAVVVFATLMALIMVLCFVTVPSANHDIVIALSGVIVGSATSIVTFYFGSSASSRSKDDTIKAITENKS